MDVLSSDPKAREHLFVLGRCPFQLYRGFVRARRVGGTIIDDRVLAQEWREIQQYVADTEAAESGVADNPGLLPLPDEMLTIAEEARENQILNGFIDSRMCQWWLVEIDRAVVLQPWIDVSYVRDCQASLPIPLSHRQHMQVSIGTLRNTPNINAARISDERYVFTSLSKDAQFLGSDLLDPASIPGARAGGYATHVVVVYVGSTINCLSALHMNNRLILTNGTHRAYMLRKLGFTHIACLVTHATDEESLAQALPAGMRQDEARYLFAKRPPLFKDFFDPALSRTFPVLDSKALLRLDLQKSIEVIPV